MTLLLGRPGCGKTTLLLALASQLDKPLKVLSRKDQEQYWSHPHEECHYVSVDLLCKKFKAHEIGQRLEASIPGWLKWGFWSSPLTYAEIGLAVNEFLAPRWEKIASANTTIGRQVLISHGLNFNGYFYWISVGALVGYILLFNVATISISFKKSPGASRAIISHEKLSQTKGEVPPNNATDLKNATKVGSSRRAMEHKRKGQIVLPLVPLTVVFQDVQYYVDTPLEMKEQ